MGEESHSAGPGRDDTLPVPGEHQESHAEGWPFYLQYPGAPATFILSLVNPQLRALDLEEAD